MKLITHPVVKLLDHTPDPERTIAQAASICYGSATDDVACTKRIQTLMRQKHYATLRFASATFHVLDISLVCSHQLVRVAHMGILQKSMRYTVAHAERVVTPTVGSWEKRVNEIHQDAYDLYQAMVASGVPKEDARYILPTGSSTQMVLTANFQTWLHWLKLRTKPSAQWEIRAVADYIHQELYHLAPNIFGDENVKS